MTRRQLIKAGTALTAASFFGVGAQSFKDLLRKAQAEGNLNTIALPPDWANYGTIMRTFERKYGIKIHNASPDASSAEELQAVRTLRNQPREPDAVDVGPAFAILGTQQGLFQPYKVPTWDSIPEDAKDPQGYWYGDYFGVESFGVNADLVREVPRTWADLKKPIYKGQIAMDGSPLSAGDAFAAVWAAALANGGSLDDITPGIHFFAELKKMGNLIPVGVSPANIERGQTPIAINWDYLNLGYARLFAGKLNWRVVVPEDGVFGNYYAQAIPVSAPHPDAARLWEDFLYSDEGQLLFLEGFAHPIRFNDMIKRGVIPKRLLAQLPPAAPYQRVRFPTPEQSKRAQKTLSDLWPSLVGQ
jgi:putative spermidine/putrescine transport system substrate-binding protein